MLTDDVRIRPAHRSDLDDIAHLHARTLIAAGAGESVDETAEYRRMQPRLYGYFHGTYHPSFAQAERIMVVAEAGELVGYGAGHVSMRMGCTGELQWLYVLPEWQRKGIGTALLRRLAEWFGNWQSTKVIVDAAPDNPCRAFYAKHGAIAWDEYWLYWPDISSCLAEPSE
jgi:GNAT superfamily N-acetyltransferase